MDAGTTLKEIFAAALGSVEPFSLVKVQMPEIIKEYEKGGFKRFLVVGFGKASARMALSVEESVGPGLITDGVVITKYGHARGVDLKKMRLFEAAHPLPDDNGCRTTEDVISLLRGADSHTFVLCLISGGGSSLLISPYTGITLQDKQRITELLLKAGADITELNTVRKHISRVKGGRLAEIASPARIVSLIVSDVLGDRLDVIASGPTAPDASTFQEAIEVIDKFSLTEECPTGVMEILHRGRDGLIPETPKGDNPLFRHVRNMILGNNMKALMAARDKAESMGIRTEIISSNLSGEARDAGRWLAEKALNSRRSHRGVRCLISGGETTVTVKGKGKGGRNTELAMSFAMEIEGSEGITLLSAGTDGTDGPTDAAGAIVDGGTVQKAKRLGMYPREYLNNNDSYNFFKGVDSLLFTGPTGTNVMDIQIILIESS